jgi:anthranilate phosphoribosyltransferase
MDQPALLHKIVQKENLSMAEADLLMGAIVTEGTPAQIGSFLTAMSMKGIMVEELAGFVQRLRADAVPVKCHVTDHIDTCGTGGGVSSFNISTAAAIIAAAAGAVVAKHGNRAVTGRCGSADVLEAIGVPICEEPEAAARRLENHGFAFLFAPKFHPTAARIGPIRKELPYRTVFNMLGPLLNPAGAKRQIVGVWDPALLNLVGDTLLKLGAEFAIVVHGEPGLDEISPLSTTQVRIIENGEMRREEWTPATFGAKAADFSALLAGETPLENGEMLIEAVTEIHSAKCLAVLPSAAVAVRLAGLADSWVTGYELAREVVRSGKASEKLEELRKDA